MPKANSAKFSIDKVMYEVLYARELVSTIVGVHILIYEYLPGLLNYILAVYFEGHIKDEINF